MFGGAELLQTQESQRVDCGGRSSRRIQTTGEGVARVQPLHGVEQRAQVDVPEWRHERVGDGVGRGSGAGDVGVDVLEPAAEVEDVVNRSHCRQIRGRAGDAVDSELRVGQAEQIGHGLTGVDASNLSGARSGAVVDVEVLRRKRYRTKAGAKAERTAADLQERRSSSELDDRVEALASGRKGGVEGGVTDAESVCTDAAVAGL